MRLIFALCFLAALLPFGLSIPGAEASAKKKQAKTTPAEEYVKMRVTGYCKCKRCTGWKRNLFFQPVFVGGPLKGRRKEVGVTASDREAVKGVIAADLSRYPFGTVMDIPCYGRGVVEDTGSAIRGAHIDLYFDSHEEALRWGKKVLTIRVYRNFSKQRG